MEHELFCKLELGAAIPDYGKSGTCALLTGVRRAEFELEAFGKGVTVYVVEADIDHHKLGLAGLDPLRQFSSLDGGTITDLMAETESLRGPSLALPMGMAVVTEGLIKLLGRPLPARQLVSVSD